MELLDLLKQLQILANRLKEDIRTDRINLPYYPDFDEIRDWCVEMRGYLNGRGGLN